MPSPTTLETFLAALPALGFVRQGHLLTKTIGGAILSVDLSAEQLIYPEDQGLIINERQTCNFSAPENFVVFECVNRLLEKGYLPRHIELEPKWKLGHGSSGGRADILIRDNLDKPLLIIECKTAGREFDRAWAATLRDGDQLFSYAQQISETQFLCLYTSFIDDGLLCYTSHIIAHRDNEKYLADNPLFRGFKDAADVKDRFTVWRDTYKHDYTPGGIFEPAIQAYHIGKDKYTIHDLHPISASDQQKQYHRFATILRQHNVSGRENAFDKLVNLFLCKLVDETENPDDLKFYWKGVAYDTHFQLLDRLQQLYQRGMGKFLGEDITYINEGDVNNALRFIRQNPDATQRAVWNLFIQQKFFTNNDFSLIDVHNEKLFYQNADVLLKILQMWQDIRLVDETRHNQFLGDMFEGFLDQGVKQSEGQFFTPMPICRFLILSLPLESLVSASTAPPKAIDYACGAGHFLTELALQLKPLVEKYHPERDLSDYHRAIHGIEKEYRLSKIAKVSAFMYQQPGIQICYADALIHEPDAYPAIQNGSFDILVANPPFSVKGFLETLPEEQRKHYRLTDTVNDGDTANSIEAFFLERAGQLLKPGGLAAIILPASILSNGGSTYTRAREILLQTFDIAAIAEFGSGTFGKTGTNTVTLFLRRKAIQPDSAIHYSERIAEWFKGAHNSKRKQVIYKDAHLINTYAAHVGIPVEEYKTLLCGQPSDALLAQDTIAACVRDWETSTEISNLKNQKKFKGLPKSEQTAELQKRRLAHLSRIEQDKLLHFLLASEQTHPVLILKSPTDNKERKTFLGYEWSSAKGDEGIKLIKDAAGHHLTPLYDETDRTNPDKINHAIARNFLGELTKIPEGLTPYLALAPLTALLDFSRTSFEKQISLTTKDTVNAAVESKWPLVQLGSVCSVNPESASPVNLFGSGVFSYIDITSVENGTGIVDFSNQIKTDQAPSRARRIVKNGDVLLSTVRPNLKAFAFLEALPERVLASTGFAVLRHGEKLLSKYLFELLFDSRMMTQMTAKMGKGQYPSINQDDIVSLLLPLPPLEIQRKIVTECDAVNKESDKARSSIAQARKAIDDEVEGIYASSAPRHSIDSLMRAISGPQTKIQQTEILKAGTIPVVTQEAGQLVSGFAPGRAEPITDIPLIIFGDHTCVFKFVDFPFVRGADGTQLIKTDPKILNPKFLCYILRKVAITNANKYERHFKYLKVATIPVPPLKDQQQFVKTVEKHEAAITAAENLLAAVPDRKSSILLKHL